MRLGSKSYDGGTRLDLGRGIIGKALEVFVEHACDFLGQFVVFCLAGPGVARIKDIGINIVESSGEGQVENGKSGVCGFLKAAVVDSVDDPSSGLNADPLSEG